MWAPLPGPPPPHPEKTRRAADRGGPSLDAQHQVDALAGLLASGKDLPAKTYRLCQKHGSSRSWTDCGGADDVDQGDPTIRWYMSGNA